MVLAILPYQRIPDDDDQWMVASDGGDAILSLSHLWCLDAPFILRMQDIELELE